MPIDGVWEFNISGPTGVHTGMLWLSVQRDCLVGEVRGRDRNLPIQHGEIIGTDELLWTVDTHTPLVITLQFSVAVIGTQMIGEVEIGNVGRAAFDATYLGHWHQADWDRHWQVA